MISNIFINRVAKVTGLRVSIARAMAKEADEKQAETMYCSHCGKDEKVHLTEIFTTTHKGGKPECMKFFFVDWYEEKIIEISRKQAVNAGWSGK